MLANIALTILDQFGETTLKKRTANPIIRYADDFVCFCDTKEEAIEAKEKIKRLLLDEIGVELSDEKTRITHVNDGFKFLGFHIQKYVRKSQKSKYHEIG